MPVETAIEWTESTWNPVTGCSEVSPGCAHCYAKTFAERWRGVSGHPYEQGFDLRLWPSRLDHPLKWKRPRMIFVNSMSDLFHEDIPFQYVQRVFGVMREASHHTFQVLTKRHERLSALAPLLDWPPNVWMGVSIENKRWVVRADHLREVPAAVRFISAEPLLGPLTGLDLTGIDWLIAGGESGPRHRPVDAEWIRALREQCRQKGVAFFFKQWGGARAKSGGRLLDGREWNDMPKVTYATNDRKNGTKVARQRDIPDSADEKWVLKAHSQAKHQILHRYLGAWLAILGQAKRGQARAFKQLVLVDGFAGRGTYVDGEPGSPRVMYERAVEVVEAGLAERVLIRCSEKDATNFEHLEKVCAELPERPRVKIKPSLETFQEIAEHLADWAEQQHPPPPTFVFADPFGVTGVSLDLLRRLLRIDRLEVLLTFMVRDPSRFLDEENYAAPLTDLYGSDLWRECATAESRPECLMLRFRNVVLDDVVDYALPYRVFEDEKQIVLYYLVHLTNSDLGMREMKKAMTKPTGDMRFYPVTMRPPDQLELEVAEAEPYPSLQKWLRATYDGRTMTFLELLNEDYANGSWLEPQYRAAVNEMEKPAHGEPVVAIARNRLTGSGKPATRGLKYPDLHHVPPGGELNEGHCHDHGSKGASASRSSVAGGGLAGQGVSTLRRPVDPPPEGAHRREHERDHPDLGQVVERRGAPDQPGADRGGRRRPQYEGQKRIGCRGAAAAEVRAHRPQSRHRPHLRAAALPPTAALEEEDDTCPAQPHQGRDGTDDQRNAEGESAKKRELRKPELDVRPHGQRAVGREGNDERLGGRPVHRQVVRLRDANHVAAPQVQAGECDGDHAGDPAVADLPENEAEGVAEVGEHERPDCGEGERQHDVAQSEQRRGRTDSPRGCALQVAEKQPDGKQLKEWKPVAGAGLRARPSERPEADERSAEHRDHDGPRSDHRRPPGRPRAAGERLLDGIMGTRRIGPERQG